jgi:RimJ/RimL family protein N-acetyltransferase
MIRNINTERLLLREFVIDDAPFIVNLLNSPTWLQFIGDRGVKNIEDAQQYLLTGPMESYRLNGFGLLMIELKEGSVPIGSCGLIKREVLQDIDIGFALLPEHAGKGYGYEAASSIMNFAKKTLALKRVVAITDPENINSINLLKKLGMHFEKMITLYDEKELMLFGVEIK